MLEKLVAEDLALPIHAVENTISLLKDGATVPFIARYRKERTGSLDEVKIIQIEKTYKKLKELESRKKTILQAIKDQGKLTPPLKKAIENTWDSNKLEDLYLPYKQKRKTKADKARIAGLEPLAKMVMAQNKTDMTYLAKKYIHKDYPDLKAVIEGAQHIIAEWVSEDSKLREYLRELMRKHGTLYSRVVKTKKENASTYRDYWEFDEKASKAPSHRILAILRGSKEGLLRSGIELDTERTIRNLEKRRIKKNSPTGEIIAGAIKDAMSRLIYPSVENQILKEITERAENEALEIFANNLRQLLLSPPLGEKSILALDPGFRTGCKLVCLGAEGTLLYHDTIFPHPPQSQKAQALQKINQCIDKYQVEAIAVGNGTAGRETQDWLRQESQLKQDLEIFLVNEDGASIYSASDIAREEFPDKDVTVRGAVSIGRRLIDPLSELVKIDPRSIGVGQYQHDITPSRLKSVLDNVVISCVNQVGVNINTASKYLLQYISGVGPTLADNIIDYREKNGKFASRNEIKKVPRMGTKSYEQCAGFLRIRNGKNPLDNTGIHPESYHIVRKMAQDLGFDIKTLLDHPQKITSMDLQHYVDDTVGLPTLNDIIAEIKKPGHDPRGRARQFSFAKGIETINDLKEGMIIPGIISNLTAFGAFVNIGIKQDGLIHISQITDKFIQSPAEVLSLNQEVDVKVIDIDIPRNRINLSLKY